VLNRSVDDGRHGPLLGLTENFLKHEKFIRSDRRDCGFSRGISMSCNTQDMSEIYFFKPHRSRWNPFYRDCLLKSAAALNRETTVIKSGTRRFISLFENGFKNLSLT